MPGPEHDHARECQRYFGEVVRPEELRIGRERIARGLEELYVRRLRIPEGSERAARLAQAVDDPDTVLVEIAHDGQIPHLGIVRMVLKTQEIAATVSKGLAVYLIGDHYSADMRPRNLYLGLPLRGLDADHVKTPFSVSVGKKNRSVSFASLPPPSPKALDDLESRAEQWVDHNASYAGRAATSRPLRPALHVQFELLRESARLVRTFGDWLIRTQIAWIDQMHGGPPSNLLVLPMTGIREWLPDILAVIADLDPGVDKTRGPATEASADSPPSRFWVYCASCERRNRATWLSGTFEGSCVSCGSAIRARWPQDSLRVMPDIVAFEMALFHTGISGWVVGSRAPYLRDIQETYRSEFGREMPPSFLLDSIPVFEGLGEPAGGHSRARLFRVLIEMDPRVLRGKLATPWEDNPVIRSPFL